MESKPSNPFSITKSADLTDEQIEALWVDASGDDAILSVARPSSPMPMFILGGKGSGKTHLMRYCSFRVQKLRYQHLAQTLSEGLKHDGYIGVYFLCGGLSSGRFEGKGLAAALWADLFSFYMELWLAQELLTIVQDISPQIGLSADVEELVCKLIAALFDERAPAEHSFSTLIDHIHAIRRKLDTEINNAAFTKQVEVRISVTRGRLIFGIPKILSDHVEAFRGVAFLYQLDEFESLTAPQQRYINTLVREKVAPASFKIGARLYGIKTRATFSGGEDIIEGSEFENILLDERLRKDPVVYDKLCRLLIVKRLEESARKRAHGLPIIPHDELGEYFATPESNWDSRYFRSIFGDKPALERQHFQIVRKQILKGLNDGIALGISSIEDVERLLVDLTCDQYPVVEKLNLLLLYQRWARLQNLREAADELKTLSRSFIDGDRQNRYATAMSHYRSDLIAQIIRENGKRQVYAGLDDFITMSEGLPRTLITLLKHIYDWAVFKGEEPFYSDTISLDAQERGVREASEWFFGSMRKAGPDGEAIQVAIERLGALFRANRFANKPIEVSLIGFSVNFAELSTQTRNLLRMAEERCFLIDIEGGQRDRNSPRVHAKLQINRMLSPRWDLPLARRGITPLKGSELEIIFDPVREREFKEIMNSWQEKMTAPSFGRRRGAAQRGDNGNQTDLFGDAG